MEEWNLLLEKVAAKLQRPVTMEDVLLQIGIRESGQPARPSYSDNERYNLLQMAEQTILVPAGYYSLLWVEDNGWPHYQPRQPLRRMEPEEKELFLRPWILAYINRYHLFA